MNTTPSGPGPGRPGESAWSRCYGWAIDQIACPAFSCTPTGAVSQCNQSAQRLWGCCPDAAREGLWDGFAALYETNGTPVAKAFSPAAIAAQTGRMAAPAELIAELVNGQQRRLVVHARPVLDVSGGVAGVLCSLTDISERHHFEHEARQADESRDLFLHILAHELRNPLAPILTAAQILKHLSTTPDSARMAEVIERQGRQLARFISDLLDAARIEQCCEIPVALQSATVGEVMALAQDVAFMLIRSRGQILHIDIGNADVRLHCDPERVAQALGNALVNEPVFGRRLQHRADGVDRRPAAASPGRRPWNRGRARRVARAVQAVLQIEPASLPYLFGRRGRPGDCEKHMQCARRHGIGR